MDWLDVIANGSGLVILGLSLYLFFKDPLRKWMFFGYKPTLMLIIFDKLKQKVLIVRNKPEYAWYFPQGGIYSSDMNGVVNDILSREFAVPQYVYKFVRTIRLGRIKKTTRRLEKKYYPGMISLYSNFLGKGYMAGVVLTDLDKFVKAGKLGYGIREFKVVNWETAMKMIEPGKARLLKRVELEV